MHRRCIALRFSLAALLFLVFCLAGFFAGFRYGVETGKSYWRGESQAVQLYDVADLLSFGDDKTRQREFAALIARLQDSVDPSHSCWRDTGGMGYVKVAHDGMHLEVLCPWKDHRRVNQAIAELRDQQRREGDQFQLVDDNDPHAVQPPVAGSGTF